MNNMLINQNEIDKIANQLLEANEKISVAESVTSGMLQNVFSQMTKASDFFEGGITAYTLESKANLLRIDVQEAEKCNCVSSQIAEEMAAGVAKLFKTQWSISITGYATPVPESNHELFAYYCIAHLGKPIVSQIIRLENNISAEVAQRKYVEHILDEFEIQLKNISEKINND